MARAARPYPFVVRAPPAPDPCPTFMHAHDLILSCRPSCSSTSSAAAADVCPDCSSLRSVRVHALVGSFARGISLGFVRVLLCSWVKRGFSGLLPGFQGLCAGSGRHMVRFFHVLLRVARVPVTIPWHADATCLTWWCNGFYARRRSPTGRSRDTPKLNLNSTTT